MYFIYKLFSRSVTKLRPENMSATDHLEEFRWHMIRIVISVLVFTTLGFIYMPLLFQEVILAPTRPDFWTYKFLCSLGKGFCIDKIEMILQSRTMSGQFTTHITSSFVTGIICAFPYVIFELWTFIKPALHPGEANMSFKTFIWAPFLFMLGILFGFYIVAPLSINFLANYRLDASIVNQFDVSSYISTLCMLVLGSGLMFLLPVLIYFLSIMGIVTPSLLSKYRKHSIIGIFVVAAIITPSPDMLSQLLLALPLYLLYEISIYVSAYVHNKKALNNDGSEYLN